MRTMLACLALCAASFGTAAEAQTPLFSADSELELIIEAPLNTLIGQARRSTDPHPAVLTLITNGTPSRFEIEISARGLSRRTRGWCAMPPLRLDFDGGTLRGAVWQGQNRLKLVTRCRSGERYEQVNAHEYLAYRLYNEITPLSYRVRPVRVTYRDTEGRRREETQLNFLIEDIDDVARRNRRVALDVTGGEVRIDQLDGQATARYALFEYMISNVDWDMLHARPGADDCCHNSKLLAASQTTRTAIIPVPYDFDSSGLADAPYAGPPPSLPIRDVRQRYYRGYCRHNSELPAAIAHFQARREALNAVIANEPRLSNSRRQSTRRYIDDFFEIIADPARVESQLIRRCRD